MLLIGWNFLSTNQKQYQDLGSARHQYGISALVTQTPFCEGSSGDLAKGRLFSQATNFKFSDLLRSKSQSILLSLFGQIKTEKRFGKEVGKVLIFASKSMYSTNPASVCTWDGMVPEVYSWELQLYFQRHQENITQINTCFVLWKSTGCKLSRSAAQWWKRKKAIQEIKYGAAVV